MLEQGRHVGCPYPKNPKAQLRCKLPFYRKARREQHRCIHCEARGLFNPVFAFGRGEDDLSTTPARLGRWSVPFRLGNHPNSSPAGTGGGRLFLRVPKKVSDAPKEWGTAGVGRSIRKPLRYPREAR